MKFNRYTKHYIKKILGRPDHAWHKTVFEDRIKKDTWKNRAGILANAELALADRGSYESEEAYGVSNDPIVIQGHTLKKKIETEFSGILENRHFERIVIHIPDQNISPAGYSLFTNFKEAFEFIGVPTKELDWNEPIGPILDSFKPTILLTSDHASYLEKIDWRTVKDRKKIHHLKIGLTASLEEYGNSPLAGRLAWAKAHSVDFYYSFRDPEYIHSRKEYRPFFDAGYKVLFMPFGAHISRYFPVAGFERDLNYVYLASKQSSKPAMLDFLSPIMTEYPGFIDGPGWERIKKFRFNRDRDRYVYARAKVGLNLHLPEQINWPCETNERTYQLAACGVPQVTDHAKLLDKIFGPDSLFIADTPEAYLAHFENIIHNPDIGTRHALAAQKEVFEKHTTYHRAASFIDQLKSL
ncbi:glycosyltransferase [Patescibacteria group bacterium]|nr:glycosyltransferase [Patescibacteria group bacterium]MDE1946813.1 glycosyltransferase [Patescibacteria group bacterium]MDE2011151.1 glycosyltransferase [Patescibacteria group bacterium]MDE2233060.1 glycosyltransferase [Patescibacteria group bacterium]